MSFGSCLKLSEPWGNGAHPVTYTHTFILASMAVYSRVSGCASHFSIHFVTSNGRACPSDSLSRASRVLSDRQSFWFVTRPFLRDRDEMKVSFGLVQSSAEACHCSLDSFSAVTSFPLLFLFAFVLIYSYIIMYGARNIPKERVFGEVVVGVLKVICRTLTLDVKHHIFKPMKLQSHPDIADHTQT